MEITYDLKKMTATFPAHADEADFLENPPPVGTRINFENQWRLDGLSWRAQLVRDSSAA